MNIQTCLQNKVGLKALCNENKTYARYLDELPGILQENIQMLVSQDRQNVESILSDVEVRGIQQVRNQTHGKLGSSLTRIGKNKRVKSGEHYESGVLQGAVSTLSGVVIPTYESQFLSVTIHQFTLYSTQAVTDKLYIYDLYDGGLITSIDFTLAANEYTTIRLDNPVVVHSFSGIFVAYDRANVQSKTVDNYPLWQWKYGLNINLSNCHDCGSHDDYFHEQAEYAYTGSAGNQNIFDTVSVSNTGLAIIYEVRCNPDAIICNNLEKVLPVLWYEMGIAFLEEPKWNNTFNHMTLLSPEEVQRNINNLKAHRDSAVETFLSTVDQDNFCFECAKGISTRITIP